MKNAVKLFLVKTERGDHIISAETPEDAVRQVVDQQKQAPRHHWSKFLPEATKKISVEETVAAAKEDLTRD